MNNQHIATASAKSIKKAYPAWQIRISDQVKSGEEFYVDLLLENPNTVNALEGVMEYDSASITPTLIDHSNSAGKLWQRPENKPYQVGEIDFLTIIPGPIITTSRDIPVMRVYFRALASGESQIRMVRGRAGLQTIPGHTVSLPTKELNFEIIDGFSTEAENKSKVLTDFRENLNLGVYVLVGMVVCVTIVALIVRRIKIK